MSATPAARGSAALWAALAACAALLFWIANGSRVLEGEPGEAWHHYDYLVDGFLQGHASLSVRPAPQLLALADPYSPAQNGPWRLWDASLYNGRFYLYFGPTPVLLMLPWRVLTGRHLPEGLAVAAFAAIGMAALALLVSGVRRKYFPGVSAGAAAGIVVAALFMSWLPVTVRRPEVWELALVAGCACLWWAIYFLWRCLESPRGASWALGAGVAVALLLGSRPTGLFAGCAVVALLADSLRSPGRRFWLACAVAAAGGAALLAYNVARFGSPLEFGQSYQLWGSDERGVRHFSAAYAPYNAWLYLLSVPDLSPYFPFLLAVPPGGEPPGYVGADEMHGALLAVPAQLAALAALAWAWKRRGDPQARALRRTIWAACLASAFAACILFCYAGSASRYISELLAGSTAAAAIGLLALLGAPAARASNILRLLAACACVWTALYVCLASAEHRILFRRTQPGAYAVAARALDYPSLWAIRSRGEVFGPVELEVRLGAFHGPDSSVLLFAGRPGMMNQLVIERPAPGRARLVLTENLLTGVAATPEFAVGDAVRVRVEAPWLYPPAQHPWWDGVAGAMRADLQTRFSLRTAGAGGDAHTARVFDSTRFAPWVVTRAQAGGATAWVDAAHRLPVPAR
jgi:hypothetical protein